MAQINEMIIACNTFDDPGSGSGGETSYGSFEGTGNSGMIILDTTCALQSISYLQDVDLLNEAKERLEEMIDEVGSMLIHM